MPLIFEHHPDESSAVGLWKISETEDDLKLIIENGNLNCDFPFSPQLKIRLGRLASRAALSELMKAEEKLLLKKEENGRPYLYENISSISLSHSGNYAAGLVSHRYRSGLDIEVPSEKILRVYPKFISDDELKWITVDKETLTLAWAAKEAVYKFYGLKELLFKEHMILQPFKFNSNGSTINLILTQMDNRYFQIEYLKIENLIVAWVLAEH